MDSSKLFAIIMGSKVYMEIEGIFYIINDDAQLPSPKLKMYLIFICSMFIIYTNSIEFSLETFQSLPCVVNLYNVNDNTLQCIVCTWILI